MAELRNRIPSVMGVTADTTLLLLVEDVVFALLDGLRRQEVVDVVAARMLIDPVLDCAEHVPLNLNMVVTQGRVVEGTQHVVDNFVNRHAGVFPCVKNPALTRHVSRRIHQEVKGQTYGTVYWRTVAAIRPAQELRTLVK